MKKRWIALGFLCVLAATPTAFAAEEAGKADEAGKEANQIDRDDWISQMTDALPGALCKEGSYFRDCFKMTMDECKQSFQAISSACTGKFKAEMPETLTQPADGEKWGGKVGECAGEEFDTKNSAKRSDLEKCNDASNWN